MNEHSTGHTRVDHVAEDIDPTLSLTAGPTVLQSAEAARSTANKVRCDACPVLCNISEGRTGACDRWGNINGLLTRVDPMVLSRHPVADEKAPVFLTGVGSGTTYPDYKPAPFIVSSRHDEVDIVTVVTEGIFSYCSFKLKIDTDRFLGPEQANIRFDGEVVGHVTTAGAVTYFNGFPGDTSATFFVGKPSPEARLVTEVARRSLDVGIEQIQLRGEADSFETVDKLVTALKGYHCFTDVQRGRVQKSRDATKIEYNLSVRNDCAGTGTP